MHIHADDPRRAMMRVLYIGTQSTEVHTHVWIGWARKWNRKILLVPFDDVEL